MDDAAEADDTIKLVLPKNNPTKMVTTTAVVNIPKRVFIAVNEFITSIKSHPVKVIYLSHNVPQVALTSLCFSYSDCSPHQIVVALFSVSDKYFIFRPSL